MKRQKTPKCPMGARATLMIALIAHLNLIGNNQPVAEAQSGSADQRAAQQQPIQNKIGLAPHDRPACQLTSPLQQLVGQQQQRRLSAGSGLENLEANQLSLLIDANNSSQPSSAQQSFKTNQANSRQQQFDSSERLRLLRGLLTQNNYDAYLVTSSDEHNSEYVADVDRRLKFISGFTGSAGYALILLDRAVLFTDGRYALQADQDLDCNWWLVVGDNPSADVHLWLKTNAAQGIRITSSASLMSMQSFDYLDEQIRSLGSKFELTPLDLVDVVRDKLSSIYDLNGNNDDKLAPSSAPTEPLFVHPLQFTGNVSWQEKVLRVADSMTKLHKARHYIISQLDEVAWLLNLRGNDIPQSPLFKAYIMISVRPGQSGSYPDGSNSLVLNKANQRSDQPLNPVEQLQQTLTNANNNNPILSQFVRLSLFVDLRRVNQQVWDHLRINNVSLTQHQRWFGPDSSEQQQLSNSLVSTRIQVDLEDYNSFIRELGDRLSPGNPKQIQGRLLLNAGANVAIHALAKDYEDRLVIVESLVNKLKAVKSDGEVQGMRLAHYRDSLAISMLLAQLDSDIGQKKQVQKWTEVSAAKELEFYRSLMDYNRGQSFDTISAYGPNGAIVHYRPNYELVEEIQIGNQSTYLLDSGGQYLDGTTDITRTVHFGEPTEFQRETYTRVLMGAIDMMSLIFDQPKRSPHKLNDLLARRHLFELGLDYAHGTGHGIGLYSLVHEAPALIEHYYNFAPQQRTGNQQQQQQAIKSGAVESHPVLLQPNMFSSVEPGYYKANDFGIRLENIVVTQRVNLKSSLSRPNDRLAAATSPDSPSGRQFLRFEPISLVPFEPKLIKLELLSNKQKTWLNSYNLMVRLRMTQQINHYLAKIRNHSTASATATPPPPTTTTTGSIGQPATTIRGLSSSSHLQQQLMSINRTSRINLAEIQLGQHNYLRLDPGRLQEKLEQTHKWIMSKTELIPLDVPQTLVANNKQTVSPANSLPNGQSVGNIFGRKRDDPIHHHHQHHHQPSGDPSMNGQRLMLAYMSSMPFNDPQAGQAIESLNEQQQQLERERLMQLDARADNITSAGSSAALADHEHRSKGNNKCSGFECDIWLVSALNSHPSGSARLNQKRSGGQPSDGWPDMSEGSPSSMASGGFRQLSGNELSASLLDLFSLKDPNATTVGSRISTGSLWSIAILSLIVVLQLGIMALMCSGGTAKLARCQGNGGRRRREWCPNGASAQDRSPSAGDAPLRVAGSVPERSFEGVDGQESIA